MEQLFKTLLAIAIVSSGIILLLGGFLTMLLK